ncbi:MAG: hypothetical protein JWR19_449 [Pedosphaera sp.]|nr:hypothetical protein [Pedosphaera sp.]
MSVRFLLILLVSITRFCNLATADQVLTNSSGATLKADTNATKPFQTISLGKPPRSPAEFNPDTGVPPIPPQLFKESEITLRLVRKPDASRPLPPAVFNPDPGAAFRPPPPTERPFFTNEFGLLPSDAGEPLPEHLALPRTNLVTIQLEPVEPPANTLPYGSEPLDKNLQLPRKNTRSNRTIEYKWENPDYPLSRQGKGFPPNSEPEPDRWRIGFTPWRRYTSGTTETPYETPKTMLWHPYKQSLLKGDAPILGQDIFLNLTAGSETEFEGRRVPTASGVSSSRPNSSEFYGQSEQISVMNNFSFTLDLFKGETVFTPVHWALHLQPVYNINYIQAHETGVVAPNARGFNAGNNAPPPDNSGIINPTDLDNLLNGQVTSGPTSLFGYRNTTRTREFFSLQEAFLEIHLGDLSENYDFAAVRLGNQAFNNDFRGFLFNDVNLGLRIFGNIDDNRYQYNFMALDLREKDTDSDLNTFDERGQRVFIANMYRQDFLWKGYTAQLSFVANLDDGGTHYDSNGNIARPAPIGTVVPHHVHAYYLGWAGDGHIGRLNLSHQFYQAFGHDDFNGLAGRPVNINAQMAALELSYDRDWIRYKASAFYASGDKKTEDGTATGFDTVVDNPNFTGGPFSYWVRQGFNLGGTSVNLKQRNSLVPDLRTSKTEGQANFVNPGALILGLGTEMDLTPKLRTFINANYIRLMETDSIKTALLTDKVSNEIGYDLSIGFQYRPLLTDNMIISAGFGTLIPGRGFKDIYQTSTDPVPGFNPTDNRGRVDDFLYSGIIAVTFTY